MTNKSGIKKVDWALIQSKNTVQKKALKEAILEAGNCKKLALLIECSPGTVSRWLSREIKYPDQDLMFTVFAKRIQSRLKINDIKKRLCPSLK